MAYIQQIHSSLAAWCRYLDRPRVAVRAVLVLLIIHTGLLAYSAYVHSPTLNEPGHLVAGLSHWKFGRFELYRVNPPLVRMVAALPVMAVGYEEDWSTFDDEPGARPVFRMGINFVRANSERSFFLFMLARWACIPFSWIGGIVCYLWARDLYGRPSGVLACTLWCFSPNILAHASLITADAHATALGLAACYTFWRWLKKPTWTQAALTGCVLGVAELAKTTLILFYPLWPLLWVLYRWPHRKNMNRQKWLREAGMLLLRMAIGLYVLNLGYGFEGSFKPLQEFHFVSDLFTGSEILDKDARGGGLRNQQIGAHNRFAGTWLGELPVPFPENYLCGIDIQQRDFEDYGRPSYLRGKFQEKGWWYYYLYAISIKVPLGTWLLLSMAVVLRIFKKSYSSSLWNDVILLAPALMIFVVVSSKTGFSEHMRYVLPCFPFLFVWISQVPELLKTTPRLRHGTESCPSYAYQKTLLRAGVSLAFLWSMNSSLWIYPHSLSYFNELVKGPKGGPEHLLNSNIDWGQDLLYLKRWKEEHVLELTQKPLHLAYYGYFNPADTAFSDTLPWPKTIGKTLPEQLDASNQKIHRDSRGSQHQPALDTGYYAISVDLLFGHSWPARDGSGKQHRVALDALELFKFGEPLAAAGYSVRVYYWSGDDD